MPPVVNVSANFGLDTKATFRHPYSADGYLKYRDGYDASIPMFDNWEDAVADEKKTE